MLFSFAPTCHCPRNFTESWKSRTLIVIVKKNSTAIFHGLYTLFNHRSDVKMFKIWEEPQATSLLWSIIVWTMASCWFVRFRNDCQGSCRINYACACNPFLRLLAFRKASKALCQSLCQGVGMSIHKVIFIVLVAHGVNRVFWKYIYHLKNNWI